MGLQRWYCRILQCVLIINTAITFGENVMEMSYVNTNEDNGTTDSGS